MFKRGIPLVIFALLFGVVFNVQAQASCFTGSSWEGPGADPPNNNRAKPIYSACGSAQLVTSDILFQSNISVDGSGADTFSPGLFVTHDTRDSNPALQATATAGTFVAQFGAGSVTGNGIPAGYMIRVYDTNESPEIQLKYGTGSTDHWSLYSNESEGDAFRIWHINDLLSITTAGLVGIGTVDPVEQLTVAKSISSNSLFSGISIGDDPDNSSRRGLIQYYKASTDDTSYMSFLGKPSSGDSLTLLGSGVMSLGNTPSQSSSNRRATFEYTQTGSDNTSYLTIKGKANGGDHLVVRGDGYVGIGTNDPDEQLHVAGDTYIDGDLHVEDGDFYIENGGFRYEDGSEGTDKVLVSDNSGNATWEDVDTIVTQDVNWTQSGSDLYAKNTGWSVGIGTTDPSNSYKLDVNGDVRLDDTLQSDDSSYFYVMGRNNVFLRLDSDNNSSGSTFTIEDGAGNDLFTANENYQFYFGDNYDGARVVVDLDNDTNKGFYVTRFGETDEGFRTYATDNDLYFEYNEDTAESNPGTWHFINQESNGTGGSIQNSTEFLTARWKGSPDNKTFVGILNTNPQYELDVGGDVKIGNELFVTGTTTGLVFLVNSDARLKKEVEPLDNTLNKILQIQPVTYYWNAVAEERGIHSGGKQYGFIAQEIESLYPELVGTDSMGYKSLMYDRVSVLLVKALQEQQVYIQELESRLEQIEQRLENLEIHD